jgi:tRNA threonylcarbamoyladenosine biosynthesis protein TsaE
MTILPVTETRSQAETIGYGRQLAATLRTGDVIALHGQLGAGKTSLVKGIADGLAVGEPITSPTYTLIHEHRSGRLPLAHIDLYRLETVDAALAIGIEDYLPGDGVTVIEWAERIADLLPAHTRQITITVTGQASRRIELEQPS